MINQYERTKNNIESRFVTVTGLIIDGFTDIEEDKMWLHVSSWGESYYIKYSEYKTYLEEYVSMGWAATNIVSIKKVDRGIKMKKRTKVVLLVTGILVVLGGMITVTLIFADMAFGLFGRGDIEIYSDPECEELDNIIRTSYKELYSDKWGFGLIDMREKRLDVESYEKIVEICFRLKEGRLDDSVLENISEIYKAVMPSVKGYMADRYASFSIEFYFIGSKKSTGERDGSIRIDCMDNCETIKLAVLDGHEISLKAVAEVFPELNQIEFPAYGYLQYDSIEDIAGFDDLQVVDFGVLLPEEDKEYILSIYPDCEIVEESYYKYKE